MIDATLVLNERWIGPLAERQRAAFYDETRPIARAFGIPDALIPADIEAFDAYLVEMIGPAGPIQVGPVARELAVTILRPPLAPLHPRLASIPPGLYAWTMWPAIELLPPAIRAGYQLPWGIRQRAVSAWLERGYRAWRPVLPVAFRTIPWANAADARLAPRRARR